jgi:hypothetical protein
MKISEIFKTNFSEFFAHKDQAFMLLIAFYVKIMPGCPFRPFGDLSCENEEHAFFSPFNICFCCTQIVLSIYFCTNRKICLIFLNDIPGQPWRLKTA